MTGPQISRSRDLAAICGSRAPAAAGPMVVWDTAPRVQRAEAGPFELVKGGARGCEILMRDHGLAAGRALLDNHQQLDRTGSVCLKLSHPCLRPPPARRRSTAELADYIKRVGADEKLYRKHIGWKYRPESEWSEVRRMCAG